MNNVNWVQQNEDYATRYHVLQWKTSHFHEPGALHVTAEVKNSQSAAAAMQAKEIPTEQEGLGLGLADRTTSGRLRLGFGLEETAANAVTGKEGGRDAVSISMRGADAQGQEAARTAMQSAAVSQMQAAEHTVTPVISEEVKTVDEQRAQADREKTTVAQSGRGNIKNRLRESAARLREAYQRQKEKAAKRLPLVQSKSEKQEEKRQKGTRAADRETVLAMQAENHYLLDSYDQHGNYSMLGKK